MKNNARVFGLFLILILFSVLTGGCAQNIQRYGMVTGIEKQNIAEYERLHANIEPEVTGLMKKHNIQNCSMYLGETEPGKFCLFTYFEYTGNNLETDLKKLADNKIMQDWSRLVNPLEKPLAVGQAGGEWSNWEWVFLHEGPAWDKVTSRHGSIIGMPEENILAYTQMHETVWSGVLASIERCNIRNYSIYLGQIEEGDYYLFSYFDYVGDDFEGDMERIGDKVTKTWWTYTDPLQRPLPTRKAGEHWASMKEIFHLE